MLSEGVREVCNWGEVGWRLWDCLMRRRPLSRSGRVGELVMYQQEHGSHVRVQNLTWSCCAGRRPRGLQCQKTFSDAGLRQIWSREQAETRDCLCSGCATRCGALRHVDWAMVGSLVGSQTEHLRVFKQHTCHGCCILANSCSSRHPNNSTWKLAEGRRHCQEETSKEYSYKTVGQRGRASTKQQQRVDTERAVSGTCGSGSCSENGRSWLRSRVEISDESINQCQLPPDLRLRKTNNDDACSTRKRNNQGMSIQESSTSRLHQHAIDPSFPFHVGESLLKSPTSRRETVSTRVKTPDDHHAPSVSCQHTLKLI